MQAPERIPLANTPTPLQPLPRFSEQLGVELLIKRDDLTGSALSGNKVRKLEYLLAEARGAGADTLITCGGEQSNHCRATAMAATQLGMNCLLLLRTQDPATPPPMQGNILLDRLAGAEIRWISHEQYADRAQLLRQEAERLRAAGRSPYVIPEGGSNALGAWGYVAACRELELHLGHLPPKPTTVIYACGSGGTGAGLILGAKLRKLELRIAGVNVCDDRDYFVRCIGAICDEFRQRWPQAPEVAASDIELIDGYVGRGYAKSQPAELALIRDLVRAEGIVLDPVYTGKAFYGMVQELASKPGSLGERIIFLHTGGIFGLFPKAAELEQLLSPAGPE